MKRLLFRGHKEANLRTKQCGKNVFQLDLNVSSLCEKHDLTVSSLRFKCVNYVVMSNQASAFSKESPAQ